MPRDDEIPTEAPPSYQQATGSSQTSSSRLQTSAGPSAGPSHSSHLDVPGRGRNGIPPERRRSMEDELRPLPKGWVRTYDPQTEHQFFVDTTKDPPRSIWTHPYDDEEYLRTLSGEERERIEQESIGRKHPSKADIMAEHTDEEEEDHHAGPSGSSSGRIPAELPPRPSGSQTKPSFGRKLKDKVTGSTHEEREAERKRRAEQERQIYEQHMRVRAAMSKAMETGQPQLVGKDKDGKNVYVEPPAYNQSAGYPGYYGSGGYGYNPYAAGGTYATPTGRYIRPAAPYGRPYGAGFGGGYGMPLALGGGLLGGMLLGDMMFGGF